MNKQDLKNILVVDDDLGVLEVIKNILENSYHVFTATMGYEALRIIHDRSIDLLTIDFMMPEMTGLDLLKELRKFNQKLPYIVISGYPPSEFMKHDLLRNSKGFLLKPFSVQELRILVDKIMANE
ncbi:MAG: response regulator [Nitrospiria bacterium]